MVSSRQELSAEFKRILGPYSSNVYFQPPESIKLSYPCIIYEMEPYDVTKADNKSYIIHEVYSATLITKQPDTGYGKEILQIETANPETIFVNDNLYHYVYKITL